MTYIKILQSILFLFITQRIRKGDYPKTIKFAYLIAFVFPILFACGLSATVVGARIYALSENQTGGVGGKISGVFSGYTCDYEIIGGWHVVGREQMGGYDLSCGCGAKIFAPIDGIIVSGKDSFCGLYGCDNSYVRIEGSNSNGQIISIYLLHLRVKQNYFGELITAGDLIGYEDSIGNSSGCHTHWTIQIDGQVIEPKFLIN